MNNPITLPGLIDVHVHLRDPGQTHKEDFLTGTSAALAGGYTAVFDMPNNAEAVVSEKVLEAKLASARKQIVSDLGVYFGSLGENLDEFDRVRERVRGLKLYLNVTTGGYKIDTDYLMRIFTAWKCDKPVLLHAEADVIKTALEVTAKTGQKTHVCHVSCREELEPILEAKKSGLPVTCGVCPHHLFLNEGDVERLGNFGRMKPELKPVKDVDYLWSELDKVDVIESDHAPHTVEEKQSGTFGVPGLETTLGLMLWAERDGRLGREKLIDLLSEGPRRVLGLEKQDATVEVEPVEFKFSNEGLKTKCGWTPFEGMPGYGRVKRVVMRGETVYEDGEVLAKPGSGQLL
ncbi:MAG: pyrC [Candidatus Saccharibacteria bacterium]|nr:pyrC [Candidatus Saccharibacteria bacterium]